MKRFCSFLHRGSQKGQRSSSSARPKVSLSSPVSRLVAEQIGRGQPASFLQKLSQAVIEEAGSEHVTPSTLPTHEFFVSSTV